MHAYVTRLPPIYMYSALYVFLNGIRYYESTLYLLTYLPLADLGMGFNKMPDSKQSLYDLKVLIIKIPYNDSGCKEV